ncbi:hypothetical protein DFH09DRAFT_1320004 [Mycena vulgaris]|nr:hypothetical protein DFH09DRAFT_1320004 [Mycena vulgaris]
MARAGIKLTTSGFKSPRFHRLSLFDNAKPSNAIARQYDGLSRPQCSVLTQLRTTHFALNAYLFRFDYTGANSTCPSSPVA